MVKVRSVQGVVNCGADRRHRGHLLDPLGRHCRRSTAQTYGKLLELGLTAPFHVDGVCDKPRTSNRMPGGLPGISACASVKEKGYCRGYTRP